MGARVFQPAPLISGTLRMPVAQSSRTKGTPTPSELSDIIHGMAKALSTRLLLMLYLVRMRVGAGGGLRVKVRRVEVRVRMKRGQWVGAHDVKEEPAEDEREELGLLHHRQGQGNLARIPAREGALLNRLVLDAGSHGSLRRGSLRLRHPHEGRELRRLGKRRAEGHRRSATRQGIPGGGARQEQRECGGAEHGFLVPPKIEDLRCRV